jgi:hypothetical protein
VARAFLEDGGKVPESEDGNGLVTSDVHLVWGASVINMANSSLVIGLEVSNTGGGMLLRSWLVNEGVMVCSSAHLLVCSSTRMLVRSFACPLLRLIACLLVCLSARVVVRLSAHPLVCSFARTLLRLSAPMLIRLFACSLDAKRAASCYESSSYNTIRWLAKK